VWAPDRDRAIARALRALDELVIEGVHTTVPAHRALVDHADFRAGGVSTKWLEHDVDPALLAAAAAPVTAGDPAAETVARTVPVEVDGKRFTVTLWLPDAPAAPVAGPSAARPRPRTAGGAAAATGSGTVTAPMQGTIVKVMVEPGQEVAVGDALLVLEAMKMENNIAADVAGTVAEVRVAPGDSVGTGDILVVIT
jgi:acetyl-CoA/propionyl-CoA carboxylase biotin carboxyl carrier protein